MEQTSHSYSSSSESESEYLELLPRVLIPVATGPGLEAAIRINARGFWVLGIPYQYLERRSSKSCERKLVRGWEE